VDEVFSGTVLLSSADGAGDVVAVLAAFPGRGRHAVLGMPPLWPGWAR
jgi:hypothetical protein